MNYDLEKLKQVLNDSPEVAALTYSVRLRKTSQWLMILIYSFCYTQMLIKIMLILSYHIGLINPRM
ncbi:MAG: hypothetical protein JSW07_17620 [bacterium]|nr:MAG: hypothetical protein JSW07_17620 [bacterium]